MRAPLSVAISSLPWPDGPTGRKPLPPHLEVEAHELLPDICLYCGSDALDVATGRRGGDNSPTEREFQKVAQLRLNVRFAGSKEGAHRACVLLDIVASCRAIGVPVQAYLTWAFERLGTHRDLYAL